MAQSVEHVIGNDEVISSILITSSKKGIRKLRMPFLVFAIYQYIPPMGAAGAGAMDEERKPPRKASFHSRAKCSAPTLFLYS